MSDLVALLLSFPPTGKKKPSAKKYTEEIEAFIKELDRVSTATYTKTVDKQSLLDLLDPAVNTIPYLYALLAHRDGAKKDRRRTEELLSKAVVFLEVFDPVQARYVGKDWRDMWEWTFHALTNSDADDLSPLSTAILRLDPSGGTFTTNHLQFLHACLQSGAPRQALPILDKNIYAIPTDPIKNVPEELICDEHELSCTWLTSKSRHSHPIKADYILEYYMLGAHIYIGLRHYSRARLFLEHVLLTPTNHAATQYMVEACKRWILLGLLAAGKPFPYPRTMDQQTMKTLRQLAKAYEALSESFEKRDFRKFQAEADAGTQIWVQDGNLGIVNHVSQALLRHRVLDLQKTFAALPLSRVAAHLGFTPDATYQLLENMIRDGYLHASLGATNSTGASSEVVLRFHFAAPPSLQDAELQAQTKRIEELVTYVREADRKLQLSKEYVEYVKRAKRSGGPDGDMGDAMDFQFEQANPLGGVGEEDEDMMADLR